MKSKRIGASCCLVLRALAWALVFLTAPATAASALPVPMEHAASTAVRTVPLPCDMPCSMPSACTQDSLMAFQQAASSQVSAGDPRQAYRLARPSSSYALPAAFVPGSQVDPPAYLRFHSFLL
jgi:hypothetical protein